MNKKGGDCGCNNITSKKGGRSSSSLSISNDHETKTALKKKTQKSSKRNIYSELTEYKWGFGLEHELMFFHNPGIPKNRRAQNGYWPHLALPIGY